MEKVERLVVRKEGDSPAMNDVTDPGTPHRTTDLAHDLRYTRDQFARGLDPLLAICISDVSIASLQKRIPAIDMCSMGVQRTICRSPSDEHLNCLMYSFSNTGNPAQRTEEIKKVEEHGAAPIVWIPFLNRGKALPVKCHFRLCSLSMLTARQRPWKKFR